MCQALLSGYTVDGTFQQYAIAKAAHVARIDKSIPLDAIAPVRQAFWVLRPSLTALIGSLRRYHGLQVSRLCPVVMIHS
jgi:hypothetical protein